MESRSQIRSPSDLTPRMVHVGRPATSGRPSRADLTNLTPYQLIWT
jgi:hypothetical protein